MVEVGDPGFALVEPELVEWAPPESPRVIARRNVGADLDRLMRLLRPGAAREFVRELPRRVDREQLFASLEALVRLLQVAEHR